jgi:lysozyme
MAAVAIIAERESLRLRAYLCPAGVPTIGWGETDGVQLGDTCTKEQADRWLCDDLADRTKAVLAMMTVRPSPNQLGALVSLAYNIGLRDDKRKRGLYYTTVRRLHNEMDFDGAARAFDLLNKARNPKTGQLEVLRGLTIRRKLEAALYVTPEPDDPPAPMPQAVEPESKLTESPLARTGAGLGLGGVVAAVQEWGGSITGLKPMLDTARGLLVDTLGVPPGLILPLALLGAAGLVVYWRRRQRAEGWA